VKRHVHLWISAEFLLLLPFLTSCLFKNWMNSNQNISHKFGKQIARCKGWVELYIVIVSLIFFQQSSIVNRVNYLFIYIHRWTCLFTWTSKLVSNSWNIFVYFQVWSLTNIYLEHHSSFSVVWKLLDISEKSLDVLYMLWTPNIWIVWICKQFANF
jgi:hypothetical protein